MGTPEKRTVCVVGSINIRKTHKQRENSTAMSRTVFVCKGNRMTNILFGVLYDLCVFDGKAVEIIRIL